MQIWRNSKMSTLYYSDWPASEDHPCVVKIDDNEILVEYENDGIVQYKGRNTGTGHFELHAPKVKGKASLHMFPNSSLLEGSWIESGYRGMWRIKLA